MEGTLQLWFLIPGGGGFLGHPGSGCSTAPANMFSYPLNGINIGISAGSYSATPTTLLPIPDCLR